MDHHLLLWCQSIENGHLTMIKVLLQLEKENDHKVEKTTTICYENQYLGTSKYFIIISILLFEKVEMIMIKV